MQFSIIIPILNQFDVAKQSIDFLLNSRVNEDDYDIWVIDNGSDDTFTYPGVNTIKLHEPIGSYRVFFEALKYIQSDIFAVFHSDFFVYEKNWKERVELEFLRDPSLGMIGFIGSNEIDSSGGRGLGTMSNFQGRTTERHDVKEFKWSGSEAKIHGKVINDFHYAAVVDGCSMILRRKAIEDIGIRENMPLHHFYDRLISTQLLEKGWKIGVLGIECDHISGMTANQENKYQDASKKWFYDRHLSPGGIGTNWDNKTYQLAEKIWLDEYKFQKHFIPLKVDPLGNIIK